MTITMEEGHRILSDKLIKKFGYHSSFTESKVLSSISIIFYTTKVKRKDRQMLKEKLGEDLSLLVIEEYRKGLFG